VARTSQTTQHRPGRPPSRTRAPKVRFSITVDEDLLAAIREDRPFSASEVCQAALEAALKAFKTGRPTQVTFGLRPRPTVVVGGSADQDGAQPTAV
jgi:hypothetical protein